MKITNKAEFNQLSQRGLLGNYLRTWRTLDEAIDSYAPWFTIQGTAPQSPYFVPAVHRYSLFGEVCRLRCEGALPPDIYFREIPSPSTERLFNAEASRSLTPHYLYVKHGAMPTTVNLRDDLTDNGVVKIDIEAARFLQSTLGGEIDTLTDIWEEHPDAIIEFSLFSRPVGVFRRKLCVWEVRNF